MPCVAGMRITYKLTVLHLIVFAAMIGLYAWVSIHREVALLETHVQRETRVYGQRLAALVRQVWSDHGERRALELLQGLAGADDGFDIRWRWITADEADGDGVFARLHDQRAPVHLGREEVNGRLATLVPVVVEHERVGVVVLEEALDDERAHVRGSARWVIVTLASAAVLLIAVAAIAGARIVGRPMRQLVAMSRRVAEGDLSRRLGLDRRDEIGELAGAMDSMCDRLEATRAELERETAARVKAHSELRHSDRLAVVGRVAAVVAHEVGTPLNVIQGHADLIRDGGLDAAAQRESAEVIGRAARRMATAIGQLLDFARRREVDRHPHELVSVVQRALGILEELARRSDVTVQIKGDMVVAEVDGAQIEQVVTNLAMNAIQAMPHGGELRIDVGIGRRHPPGTAGELRDVVSIVVSDTGPGIPAEHHQSVFEPFFTTKPVGQGSGLGLPIVRAIVEEHGGWIECESEPGVGSTFVVCLPRRRPGS